MYDCSKHIISQDASLIEAIERINGLSGQSMVLFAVDDKQRMTGTLTDGDVRRFLIAKRSLDVTVREIMHRNFRRFEQGKISVEKVREVRDKLERTGLKTYTQVVDTKDGKRTRVRLGPFDSRAEADKAVGRVKGVGLSASVLAL